jgi:hypothetical protein
MKINYLTLESEYPLHHSVNSSCQVEHISLFLDSHRQICDNPSDIDFNFGWHHSNWVVEQLNYSSHYALIVDLIYNS